MLDENISNGSLPSDVEKSVFNAVLRVITFIYAYWVNMTNVLIGVLFRVFIDQYDQYETKVSNMTGNEIVPG